MNRKHRSDDELRKVSDDLFYEIRMFECVAKGMALGITGEGVINNAFLESFGIHARNLLDFLYAERPQHDDVVAEDWFSSDVKWHQIRPVKSEALKKVHKRVAKELAHLTYARLCVTPETKTRPFIDIFNDIRKVLDVFLDSVPEDRFGNRCKKLKKQLG